MASPPYTARSPPRAPSLTLPMKRPPSLVIPNQNAAKRRKPSATSQSAHPLRQTSFPPPDPENGAVRSEPAYSPELGPSLSRSPSFDSEINSVVTINDDASTAAAATAGRGASGRKKRKRVGRPARDGRRGSASLLDGEARSTPSRQRGKRDGTGSALDGDGYGEAEEEEEDALTSATAVLESGKPNAAQERIRARNESMLVEALDRASYTRYTLYKGLKLRASTVRRITNQTLSQSVPASVVTVINTFTKLFAGDLIESASQVRDEWIAAAPTLPTGEKNEGRGKVEERDRGPLTPDHLREALRRYKRDGRGAATGFVGLSLEGRENTAIKLGGKRLFR
ncbi:hypothetical protein LTR50_005801 [Elasticomyces elasticus]|nr:hypothetical protein LTR50_005801 [Elasticomyces elasticus]